MEMRLPENTTDSSVALTKKVFQMSSCWTSGQKLYNEDSEELRGSQNLRQQLGIVSEHMNC
ncbi:hypothetical protein T4B_8963 [Trichinella pseudospiralis]|uniref:Uncharacterized protein n=1 Tax=Trichinella pseudospiralis TaxID=6337 RepID=A0A0V1ICX0_TRIPS|nr:hypothetical protein T4B_8963 [Trichinella pseudospiralis]